MYDGISSPTLWEGYDVVNWDGYVCIQYFVFYSFLGYSIKMAPTEAREIV